MMETLLAVAVRPSDGRVGTVSLPLPNTQPLPFACSVLPPAPRWHQSVPLLLGRSPCYPCCYPLTPAAFLVLPLLPLQFPLFFDFPPFPRLRPLLRASPSHTNPRGPGMFLHMNVPQAVAWGSMQRAARVKISLSSVEIWLLVWCEVVSACLIGCHACLRTAWFVLQDFWVWGGGQAWVRFQAWLSWLLE